MGPGSLGYDLVKSGHIISVVAWMAAQLYLPRLFVYHAGVPAGSPQSETFKLMERRLLRAIMTPAMIATWVFGLWLAIAGGWFGNGMHWLDAKLLFVLVLSGLHGYMAKVTKDFGADRNTRPARFFRIVNEVPTVCLVIIVLLVVVKPF